MADSTPPLVNILHAALTVTDAESSAAWYERTLGFRRVITVPHAGGFGIVMCTPDERVWVVLHHHEANQQESFSETRTGLDHLCFQVDGYEALEAWREWFTEQSVKQEPITYLEDFGMSALVFRDPDDIQLELITYGGPGSRQGHPV
jgi:glyoxylase I family protein